MNQSNQADLGNGSIGKLLLKMAAPTIVAQVINMLYNMVDRMYIGHIPEVGSLALTGVGITFPIIMMISAFSSLIGMGGAPRAAISLGAGDKENANKILGNCVVSLAAVSVILTAVVLIFGKSMLRQFGATEGTTLEYGAAYLNIYALGTIFVQTVLGLNIFITTQGFSMTAMKTILIGAITNIIRPHIYFCFWNGCSRCCTCHHHLPGYFCCLGSSLSDRQKRCPPHPKETSEFFTFGHASCPCARTFSFYYADY